MSEECTHDCSTCSSNCGSKDPKSLLVAPHPNSKIGKVIGVVSGKGRRRKINGYRFTCG